MLSITNHIKVTKNSLKVRIFVMQISSVQKTTKTCIEFRRSSQQSISVCANHPQVRIPIITSTLYGFIDLKLILYFQWFLKSKNIQKDARICLFLQKKLLSVYIKKMLKKSFKLKNIKRIIWKRLAFDPVKLDLFGMV